MRGINYDMMRVASTIPPNCVKLYQPGWTRREVRAALMTLAAGLPVSPGEGCVAMSFYRRCKGRPELHPE